MNTEKNNNRSVLANNASRVRIIGLSLLVGTFGLLLGTLIRPSEAAQNYEYRISALERQLNQMQFTFTQMDRRISQIENQAYSARAQPTPSQPATSDTTGSLNERRIDELQSQLQTQGKMINELYKMIGDKQKQPAKEEKPDEKKKPALAGKPNP